MAGILANAAGAALGPVGPLLGIGAQLLGGIFQRKQALDDVENQFVRLRAGAEKAGFNPLSVLGGGYSGIPAASFMGSAIADSAMMVADEVARKSAPALGRMSALELENQNLRGQLTRATLRPTVPGIYGRGDGGPGGGKVGAGNGQTSPSPVPLLSGGGNVAVNQPEPLFIDFLAPDGTVVPMANPNSPDADQDIWAMTKAGFKHVWDNRGEYFRRVFDPTYNPREWSGAGLPAGYNTGRGFGSALQRDYEYQRNRSWGRLTFYGPGARNQDF